MAKGFMSPFLPGKSSTAAAAPSDDQHAQPNPSRMSTSSRFPSLRRLETHKSDKGESSSARPTSMQSRMTATTSNSSDLPAWLQPPASSTHPTGSLLHLKFSGPSFLDVVAKDAHSKEPLYVIETVHDTTTIYRLDPRTRQAVRAGGVQWPQNIAKGKTSGRTVQIGNGRWRDAEEFLKFGTLTNFANRRFNIPHWPHPLKWKLVPGNSYYCTTQDIKGPVAVLDAAVLSAPPRLRIYNNMTSDGERLQQNIKGVPILLLDYLITTSLLLVTEVQEWLDRPQTIDGKVRIPGSSAPAVQKWLAIIHGEPAPTSPASPTLTAVSSQGDDRSYRHSGGTASIAESNFSDPFTPSTPATSAGSYFAPRDEDIPPVPPLPETVRLSLQNSELPHSTYPSSDCLPARSYSDIRPSTASSSTHVPSPPPSKTQSLRSRGSRPLPTPPSAPSSSLSAPRPWPSAEIRTPSPSTPGFDRPASPASSSSSTSNSRRSRGARSSIGRSLTVANMPPLLPPPISSLPLPPKLAQEFTLRHESPYGGGESSAAASASVLQMSNPDPAPPDEEARVRQAVASMQAMNLSPPMHAPPLPAVPPPPLASVPSIAYHQNYDPTEPMRDAGVISMNDAARRASYAETIYEMPPPAYDAIDFSLPQVNVPRR